MFVKFIVHTAKWYSYCQDYYINCDTLIEDCPANCTLFDKDEFCTGCRSTCKTCDENMLKPDLDDSCNINKDENEEDGNSTTHIIIIVCVVLGVVLIIVILVLVARRKNWTIMRSFARHFPRSNTQMSGLEIQHC